MLRSSLLLILFLSACPSPTRPTAESSRSDPVDIPRRTVSVEQALRTLWPASRDAIVRATSDAERSAVSRLLPVLLTARSIDDPGVLPAAAEARDAALQVEAWKIDSAWFWLVRETPGTQRGAGVYLLRIAGDRSRPLQLLETPHRYFDLHTGTIGLQMVVENPRFIGLFANSVQRYRGKSAPAAVERDSPADLAHQSRHLFTHATRVMAETDPSLAVIQLHGFGDDSEAQLPAATSIIVSAGKMSAPTTAAAAVVNALRPLWGSGVILYPRDTSELGGTTNSQARLLAGHRQATFLHLELSRNQRQLLRAHRSIRDQLARAIATALEAPDSGSRPSATEPESQLFETSAE